MSKDEAEVRRRLAEQTRRHVAARINETTMNRRYNALSEFESNLRTENSKIKEEICEMELKVAEKLANLRKQKEVTGYRIAALQKQVENSIPIGVYEQLQRKNTEITEKYRKLLEQENLLQLNAKLQGHLEVNLLQLFHF